MCQRNCSHQGVYFEGWEYRCHCGHVTPSVGEAAAMDYAASVRVAVAVVIAVLLGVLLSIGIVNWLIGCDSWDTEAARCYLPWVKPFQ